MKYLKKYTYNNDIKIQFTFVRRFRFCTCSRISLLLEFHSATEAGLEEELDLVEEICSTEGCLSFHKGMGRDERDRLWKMRHQTYEVLVRNNPGTSFVVCDVAAPASAYPQ